MSENPKPNALPQAAIRQSNHQPFQRPALLAHLPVLPLYLLAAHWALLTGELLTSSAIGQTFGVEPRRARQVLRYLQQHPRKVLFERLAGRRLQLRVLAVSVLPVSPGRPRSVAESGLGTESEGPTRAQREAQRRRARDEALASRAEWRRRFLTRPLVSGKT